MNSSEPSVADVMALLDDAGYPSSSKIATHEWTTAVAPDFPSILQIEALCEVARNLDLCLRAISINGDEVDQAELLNPVPSVVMGFLVSQSYACVVLSAGWSLHMLKDASSRFSIYFGEPKAVQAAYLQPLEADESFRQWVSSARFNSVERASLNRVFSKYRSGGK